MAYKPDTLKHPYACSQCGAEEVRLWRGYQRFLIKLACFACTKASQTVEDPDGESEIGWCVPAVPTNEGTCGFWGYLGIPEEGWAWWRSLPLENPCSGCGQNPCTGGFTQCRSREPQYETRVYAVDPDGTKVLLTKSNDKHVAQAAIQATKP